MRSAPSPRLDGGAGTPHVVGAPYRSAYGDTPPSGDRRTARAGAVVQAKRGKSTDVLVRGRPNAQQIDR